MTGHIIGMTVGAIIIVLCFIIYCIWYFKNQKYKSLIRRIGQKAEEQINDDLKVWARHTRNHFIPASLYKYNENKFFEVDGILITDRALIVVEIKSIRGGVTGDCQATNWVKKVNQEQFKILNPVLQNERHIDHIVRMTGIKVPTLSLIIFANRANYISVSNTPNHVLVTRHADMFDTLEQIQQSLPIIFTDYDVKSIVSTLRSFRTSKKRDQNQYRKIVTGALN